MAVERTKGKDEKFLKNMQHLTTRDKTKEENNSMREGGVWISSREILGKKGRLTIMSSQEGQKKAKKRP